MRVRVKVRVGDREGFVLPVVIFALAIMGVLAVVSLRTADDNHRSSRALRESGAALYAAEAGASLVRGTVTDTSGTVFDSIALTLAPGDSADLGWLGLPGGGSYKVLIQRVDSGGSEATYTLTAEGRARGLNGGQGAITMVLTGTPLSLSTSGAIAMADGTGAPPFSADFTGNNFKLQGSDTPAPSGSAPGCPSLTNENKTGLSVSSQTAEDEVTASVGNNQHDQFVGLKPGTTNQYTPLDSWDADNTVTAADLQALVDALSPGATSLPTGCTKLNPDGILEPAPCTVDYNLGTPANPGLFLADGPLGIKLGGSAFGYGVLIVIEGLEMVGSYQWEGIILAVGSGKVNIHGSGNKLFGTLMAANTRGGSTYLRLGGGADFSYSSQALCRVKGLLGGVEFGSVIAVVPGSWMQLTR